MGKKNKSENVQVIVRVRPLNGREKEKGATEVVHLDIANNTIAVDGAGVDGRAWAFDGVYNNSFSQRDVYLQSIHAVVETVLQGFNATIFAYGQSGTGKTFSMAGDLSKPEMYGIIPNALNHIFETISNLNNEQTVYSVQASFTELYNGKCRDLLVSGQHNLELKENPQKQFFVKDLSHWEIDSTKHAMELMDAGLLRREVKSTDLNADSSRSHSLFSVYVRVHDKINDVRTESKLNLVDLAGSERQSKSGATGETLVEGNNINLSLTALGTVIDCLVKGKPHIPYRSSPLTMLLKDGLGGNSRTVIVGTCSPGDLSAHETVSSLRFLDRAKQIKNKPKVQMDPKDAKIAELLDEVKTLKARLGLDENAEVDEDDTKPDEAAKANYIHSLEPQIEALKNKVEELEVALQLANDAAEAAQKEVAGADARYEELRQEFLQRERKLEEQFQHERDTLALKAADGEAAAATGTGNERLTELLSLCVQFIETHDHERRWAPAKKKTKADEFSIEEVSNGFRALDTYAAPGSSGPVGLTRRESIVRIPVPVSADTAPAGSLVPPTMLAPHAPAGDAPRSVSPAALRPGTDAAETLSARSDLSARKKDKKEKKEKKEKKRKEKADLDLGCVPAKTVAEVLGSVGVTDPNVQEAMMRLLEQQRDLARQQLAEVAASADGGSADEIVAAYEMAKDDLVRLRAQATKQKALADKVKTIAEKRSEEADKLKEHVDSLREELAGRHAQHAGELALQQDQLVVQHNKKTDALVTKHSKALVKEKKQREKLQEKITALEETISKIEQDYDVKVMEYEALHQNYEAQKVEALRKFRELSGGFGGASVGFEGTSTGSGSGGLSSPALLSPGMTPTTNGLGAPPPVSQQEQTAKLRRALNKAHNAAVLAGLNTSYDAHANDHRLGAKSAPEGIPAIPALPSNPSPFSRNFLDHQ